MKKQTRKKRKTKEWLAPAAVKISTNRSKILTMTTEREKNLRELKKGAKLLKNDKSGAVRHFRKS